ncbi:MAG: alpha/beta fold hydrolase [Rhodospirillales bacterium]|nr:alpha/beta fold hydrolase [Rhodospirillales bacterium]
MSAFPGFGPNARTRRIQVGDVSMRVVDEGEGPEIVFIPGGDQPAEGYSHIFAELTDSFHCYAFDPRGIQGTDSPPAPWTMSDFANDCAGLIEHLCDGPTVVSGLSMGGLITEQLAIDHPDTVRLAIPMGTSAYIDGFTRDWMEAEIRLRREGVELPEYFLPVHYAVYAYPAKALHDPELWDQIKSAYTARFGSREAKDTINQWQACLDFDVREDLPHCPVPFHVIAFSEDVQTAPRMCKMVSDLAKDGTFHEVPELGHVSMVRHRPKVVADKIREIVTSVLG